MKKSVQRHNINFKLFVMLVGIMLPMAFSEVAQSNPCEDPSECREISELDAVAMSKMLKPGIRDYDRITQYQIKVKGTFGHPELKTYRRGDCEHARRSSSDREIVGLSLKNSIRVGVTSVLKYREVYRLEKITNQEIGIRMTKEIINGSSPESVLYRFGANEVYPGCFENNDLPFEKMEVVYNTDADHLRAELQRELRKNNLRKSYDLGRTSTGFSAPVNNIEPVLEMDQTGGYFGYDIRRKRKTLEGGDFIRDMRGHMIWDSNPISGEVYEANALLSSYEDEAIEFLEAETSSTEVKFWLEPRTQTVYMVFSNDPYQVPVEFRIDDEHGEMTMDGDAVFYEDKTVSAFVIMGLLDDMTKLMRGSAYKRSYKVLADSVEEFKSSLTNPDENGKMRTEANPDVSNLAHIIYYTTHTFLRQRIEMDTAEGKRRTPVVNAMVQQVDHMLADYGFDDVRSGAPLYAIYGGYITDTITEIRIPGWIDTVPEEFKPVANALEKLFKKAESLKIREELSDANIKTGKIVDEVLIIYDREVHPLVSESKSKGMIWNGYELKLEDYIESLRGIRNVDEVGGLTGATDLQPATSVQDAGSAPKPKRRRR